jgi:hypothetical protein
MHTNHYPSACSPKVAAERTKLLFNCFRRNDASDPDTFVTAVAALLSRYPEEIVRRVTHPVDGLPASHTFPPSVAEVKAACENLMGPVYAARKREIEAERMRHLLAPPVVTAEQRERATRKWFDEIRPTMAASDKPAPETPDQAKAKLRAMRSDLDDAAFDEFWISLGNHVPKTTFQTLKGQS